MILILGGSGYVGSEFRRQLTAQTLPFRSVRRSEVDYTKAADLQRLIRDCRPTFLINAAGYTGKPNVDACEDHRDECYAANVDLPAMIADVCADQGVPWGHVSSGCIYDGPSGRPEGYVEDDPPNFCFDSPRCSYYSGCKALGEQELQGRESVYVWRMRLLFDNRDGDRNYISKLMRYDRLIEVENSISEMTECVAACIRCHADRIPFGTYNVTNPRSIKTSDVTRLIQRHLAPTKQFRFFADEDEFMAIAAKTPRSNCVLDSSKLARAGIGLTPVRDALVRALENWVSESAAS